MEDVTSGAEIVRLTEQESQANAHAVLQLCAWPLLIHAGGLAEQTGNRLQLTARGRAALSTPAAETVRQLWRRWVSHGLIDEMSRIDAIKGQRCANVLTAPKPRRQTVATARPVSGSPSTSCSP